MDILQFAHENSRVLKSRGEINKDLVESLTTEEKSAFNGVRPLLAENSSAVLLDSRDTNNLQQIIHRVKQAPESETNLPEKTMDSPTEAHHVPDWQNIPAVILYEIYSRLSFNDRLSASASCRNWRDAFFDARLWQNTCLTFHFKDSSDIACSSLLAKQCARCVRNVTLQRVMNTYSSVFVEVLRQLSCNSKLERLSIDLTFPTDAEIMNFDDYLDFDSPPWGQLIYFAVVDIVKHSCALKQLILLGLAHDLIGIASWPDRLSAHQRKHLTHLALASLEDPDWSVHRGMHEPLLNLADFISLTTLTLNYSHLSDSLLYSLTGGTLERLVVHVHGWSSNYPGTTDDAWKVFRANNPCCGLRLNILRSTAGIDYADLILKPSMPLTHFKALFCKCTSYLLVERIAAWYTDTLKSFVWIDSGDQHNYNYPTRKDKFGEIRSAIARLFIASSTLYEHELLYTGIMDELIFAGHSHGQFHVYRICELIDQRLSGFSLRRKNGGMYDIDEFRHVIGRMKRDETLWRNALLNGDSQNLMLTFLQEDIN